MSFSNQIILDTAEHAMNFGCWQYYIKNKTFQCSEGMTNIFGATASLRDPSLFLDYSISEDRAIAERIVYVIKNDPHAFEERIRIQAEGSIKTLNIKASLFTDEAKDPSIMVGVVGDITTLVASQQVYQEQTHLFSNILKTVPGLISIINLSTFDIEYINKDFSFYLDESATAPEGTTRQIIHPEDGPILKNYVKNFLTADDDVVSTVEYRARAGSGEWEWFRAQGKVFKRDKLGIPTHSVNVAQNINTAKKAEEESARIKEILAAQARRQYEDLFRSIDQGFIIVELIYENKVAVDCLILQANPAFEKITTCRNVTGKTLRELLPAAPVSWLLSLSQIVEQKKAHRFTVCARELRGAWYDIYAFPTGDPEAGTVAVLFNDITDQKMLEQQKDQFIAVASHELKTPVTSIRAYAEVLLEFLKAKGDAIHAAMMERMVSQTDRLTRLINDLLDTTKIAEGVLSLEPGTVDLNDLIRASVEEIQPSSKHSFTINAGAIPTISADKNRIGQVLTNLLTNAVKYSPEGSRIVISTALREADVMVSVRDEGIGLAEDTHDKVFDRFYRIKGAANSAIPGFGLGLFIAQEIINKHRGTLGVRSKPGEGAEFFFTLPLTTD